MTIISIRQDLEYSDVELVCSEQGNSFRNVDLMVMPKDNDFVGAKFVYPFYRYSKWDNETWFNNDDVERYIPSLIEYYYEDEAYYMLQGYLSSKEPCAETFREVWMQIRTYLYSKEKKLDLLKWFDNQRF